MRTVSLSGSLRESVGKKDAKKHRREGNIPCVMYGGKEQVHFVASEKSLAKILNTPIVSLITLDLGGKAYEAIFQDVQYHPVTDHILHIDFLEIQLDKPVTIGVPFKLEGVPEGVLKGGKLEKKMRKLKVKALTKDLPDHIDINVAHLEIGQSVKVSDLVLENVIFLDSPNNVIVGVRTARTVVEEAPVGEEGAAAEGAAEEGEKKEETK
ncbi:MAG: 50S ribosomal protein L25/general stress protein Ctc, partial [bacterium]